MHPNSQYTEELTSQIHMIEDQIGEKLVGAEVVTDKEDRDYIINFIGSTENYIIRYGVDCRGKRQLFAIRRE